MSQGNDDHPKLSAEDLLPLAADVFPGDAAECATTVGVFADGTPWPLGWVVGLAGIGSAVCAWLFVPTRTGPRLQVDGPVVQAATS
jgi:DHA1 family bicyclomycin/chloramphenicol resistance-like MFS transporter